MNTDNSNTFYSVKETAEIFGTSGTTMYAWVKNGDIGSIKIKGTIRIPKSEILKLIR